ncbi:sugar porter family MFS transporter [Frateuria aurantia]|uniref:MFS transporter, sugar porter family n=1 Tax=Frateuria aurantia (strain ATCC 33424 / DSM 6220 / KCTC 2777 / LMG 1558 / NBRC 3245 / NCIMB 13370) TaxID=767434 RepID=H8L258_FRAAD|nr:sugar porter family MFS transporter [Frateuria aurantia]AFC87566.1 MFS transporter, sugar porter family [Frateuria aurantia DSM 6220]
MDSDSQYKSPTTSLSASGYMTMIASIAAIAGGLYGYDTGIISGALGQISHDFSLSHVGEELVTAAILAGAVIGSLVCTQLSAGIGRRRTIMVVASVYVIGVLAAAASPNAWLLGISRLVLGFAVGGCTQIVPTYIAELAPPDKRGRLVTYFNVSIGVGILIAALVGFGLQDRWSWRIMIGVAVIPSLGLLLGMTKLPFSPRWLVEQDEIDAARQALMQVRETRQEVREEIRDIQSIQAEKEQASGLGWGGLAQAWVRPALIAGLGVAAFTQLSGIEMMIYYTPTFLSDAGFGHSAALLANVGVAVVYLTMTFCGKLIVDRVGRRHLALWTAPFAALALFVMGAVFKFDLGGAWHGQLVVACLLTYMLFTSIGIQVIGWLIGSEIYPLGIRDKATGLHSAMLWGSNLLLTVTALSMTHWLGVGGAMVVYGLLNVAGFLFVLRRVPETAGRSLEDIEQALKDGSFLPGRHRG